MDWNRKSILELLVALDKYLIAGGEPDISNPAWKGLIDTHLRVKQGLSSSMRFKYTQMAPTVIEQRQEGESE